MTASGITIEKALAARASEGEPWPPVDLGREKDFHLAGIEIRPSAREVCADGNVLNLEPRAMQVLVALTRQAGVVVTREALVMSCWGGRIVSDDAVQRCVALTRRVGESTGAYAIETVSRVGYRLTPSQRSENPVPELDPGAQPRPRLKAAAVAMAAAVAAVCAAVAVFAVMLASAADTIPRSITWTYHLGKYANAPNGLRFLNSWDGRVWSEAFADGRIRDAFVLVSRYRGPNGCNGALLRRDRSLIVFVPNDACAQRVLFAQDIDPATGVIERDWFVLGQIVSTSATPMGLRGDPAPASLEVEYRRGRIPAER